MDGQQRLVALSALPDKGFRVFVSLLVCSDPQELRRQFVLINSTRPLPKALIHELLPEIDNLSERLSLRAGAAELTERLNHDERSSLRRQIYQHTNPTGTIKDTAIQRVIMSSTSDGALRELQGQENANERLVQRRRGGALECCPERAAPDHGIGAAPRHSCQTWFGFRDGALESGDAMKRPIISRFVV